MTSDLSGTLSVEDSKGSLRISSPRPEVRLQPESELDKAIKDWHAQLRHLRQPFDIKTEHLAQFKDAEMPDWYAPRVGIGRHASLVYFVQRHDGGPIKIGASNMLAINGRLSALQIGNSEKLELRRLIYGDDLLEHALHRYFKHIRVRGEWFRLNDELAEVSRAIR